MIRVGVNRVCASSNSGEDFFEGPRNDVVQVFVDDTLVHTGTSWEDFFRYCEATDTSRTVDSLLLQARTSGGTAPGTSGYGFLVDNLDLESGPAPCPSTLQSGCQPAESRRAQLFLRNGTLKWRWISSADVATADFGDPTTMSHYVLCIYDASSLTMSAQAPAGGTCGTRPCWRTWKLAGGFKYVAKAATPPGLRKLFLRAGSAGRARIQANPPRGAAADLPTLPWRRPSGCSSSGAGAACAGRRRTAAPAGTTRRSSRRSPTDGLHAYPDVMVAARHDSAGIRRVGTPTSDFGTIAVARMRHVACVWSRIISISLGEHPACGLLQDLEV